MDFHIPPFLENILFVGMLGVVAYIFLYLPQKQKKQDQHLLETFKVGDRVVTIGGIHGIIVDIAATSVLLQLIDGQLQLDKQAISIEATQQIYRSPPAESKKHVTQLAKKKQK